MTKQEYVAKHGGILPNIYFYTRDKNDCLITEWQGQLWLFRVDKEGNLHPDKVATDDEVEWCELHYADRLAALRGWEK